MELISAPTGLSAAVLWNGNRWQQTGSSLLGCFQFISTYSFGKGFWVGVGISTSTGGLGMVMGGAKQALLCFGVSGLPPDTQLQQELLGRGGSQHPEL